MQKELQDDVPQNWMGKSDSYRFRFPANMALLTKAKIRDPVLASLTQKPCLFSNVGALGGRRTGVSLGSPAGIALGNGGLLRPLARLLAAATLSQMSFDTLSATDFRLSCHLTFLFDSFRPTSVATRFYSRATFPGSDPNMF
jgi:hypothetical protein